MGIFDFERLFDLNHDGMLDPLEKGLEFTVIEDIMNDDEDNDDLFSSDLDDELTRISTMISDFIQQTI